MDSNMQAAGKVDGPKETAHRYYLAKPQSRPAPSLANTVWVYWDVNKNSALRTWMTFSSAPHSEWSRSAKVREGWERC
jgi:hypothetical protein